MRVMFMIMITTLKLLNLHDQRVVNSHIPDQHSDLQGNVNISVIIPSLSLPSSFSRAHDRKL